MNFENVEQQREWLSHAYSIATKSTDPSTQNGSFLVSGSRVIKATEAVNGPCFGWSMGSKDWERPRKYALVEHAERNSLYSAARVGVCTTGLAMVACWASCADCARAIVQCGISVLIRHNRQGYDGWVDSIAVGDDILFYGGVRIIDVYGPIPGAPDVLFGERLYSPEQDSVL